MNVEESAEIRKGLAQHGAEYHVVKNRLLNVALKEREIEGADDFLAGPTALIIGGDDPSGTPRWSQNSPLRTKKSLLGRAVQSGMKYTTLKRSTS